MKRPLFIISLNLILIVFCFNFLPPFTAFLASVIIAGLSLVLVRNDELKAVFVILILLTSLTSSFYVMKNEKIIKNTDGILKNYRMCVYEVREYPKACTLKGKLFLDDSESINDVSIYLVPKSEYFPGDIVNISCVLDYGDSGSISLKPNVEKAKITAKGKGLYMPYFLLGTVRESLNEAALSITNRKISSLFPSLLTGSKKYLKDEIKDALYDGGISHIAAVSGLHLSIILGAVFFVFPFKRKIKLVLAVFLCFFVMGISAFSPSVMRASAMALLFILAGLLNRNTDGITSLSLFLTVVSVFSPRLLFSLSTWFSCLSVFGILHFVPYILKKIPESFKKYKPLNFLIGSLAVSFSSSLMTLPLCLYFFGRFSVLSILLNVLVVPVITVVLPALWIEVLLIFIFNMHIPILDFLLTKICECIINLASAVGKEESFVILGGNYKAIAVISLFLILLSVMVFKKSSLKQVSVLAFVCLAVLSGLKFTDKDDMYIFFPDSMKCAVVKNKEQAVLIGNLTKEYEAKILKSTLRRYDVRQIVGVLADQDPSASAVMYEFLEDFKSPALDEEVRAVDFENFLPFNFLSDMGISIKKDEEEISFDLPFVQILKIKNKCVIMTDMKIRKVGNVNVIRL